MKRHVPAALLVVAFVLAGCGQTRTLHVPNPRAKIRDNTATPSQVRAKFAGKPADQHDNPLTKFHCEVYGSPQRVLNGDGPAWVLQVCYRGLVN
jgi:hypothetical protein